MRSLGRLGAVIVVATCLGLGGGPIFAQAPGLVPTPPPPLEEVDALRIGKLQAERQLLVEEYRRIQSEQAARDRAYQERGTVLNAAILEAAAKAKLDLKEGWRPDPERRVWVK